MLISSVLYVLFSTFCLVSALFVIYSKNPVFSVLFLIFAFFNVASILFLFKFEFLPISFLVIYVGAIAVLFLFILMMLNIKITELYYAHQNFLPFSIALGVIFVFELLTLFNFEFATITTFSNGSAIFLSDFLNNSATKVNFLSLFSICSNVQVISYALFTNYLFSFLISSFVLLLAMTATIILTFKCQKSFTSSCPTITAIPI